MFQHIIGRDNARTKIEGLQKICTQPGFNINTCIFITDTVGDILELQSIIPKDRMYVVNWGFHTVELLTKYISADHILDNFKPFVDSK